MNGKPLLDITPHPAILQVLGEIEFKPWQCIAEFIDNSIDGFLEGARTGRPIEEPTVNVHFGRDSVVVKDNGPGMALETLEMAVKAGWTSHDRFGSLGLYGVGFNIATARLGSLTTIWTTRPGDEAWHGVSIDLQGMARGGNYKLPVKTRTKSHARLSGTEVEVSRIKADWQGLITNGQWLRHNVKTQLSKVYGAMLRDTNPQPIGFRLRVNDGDVAAWEHCVWPADWDVYRRDEGRVRPIQEIDITIGTKYASRITGEFYERVEDLSEDEVVEVPERVYGWLGVQRYADKKEYGVDVLRNGRKIEVGCKDIFDWEDNTEYVIDDPSQRGRIVGEIHLDHGYVNYTKHRFEREHSSWKQLLKAARHNEPLTNRSRHGYSGVNSSPLGILFRAFRRNRPQSGGQGYRDILFVEDNEKAKAWAREYRKGNPEFRDNEKWLKELESSDNPLPEPEGQPGPTVEGDDASGQESGSEVGTGDETVLDLDDEAAEPPAAKREPIPELTFHMAGIGRSGNSYDVEVYAVEPTTEDSMSSPWRSRVTERGVFEVDVNLGHPAFNSTSFQVRDAVLADVAHYIASEESALAGPRDGVGYGDILVALRAQHATADSLDANQLREDIEEIRERLTERLSITLSEDDQQEFVRKLPPEEVRRVRLASAQMPTAPAITKFLETRHLAILLDSAPDLFFEAGCFRHPWTPKDLTEDPEMIAEYRERLLQDLRVPLAKLGEFVGSPGTSPHAISYLTLMRAYVNWLREGIAIS